MGKGKKFHRPLPASSSRFRIPESVDYDQRKPIFSLREIRYGNPGCISTCLPPARSSVLHTMLKLSQFTWAKISTFPKEKLGYEKIPRNQFKISVPSSITQDIEELVVFRYSDGGRIAGYRINDVFNIVLVGEKLYPH